MASWLAGLAGLGEGATALGSSLSTERLLAQERQRQSAIDALGKLKLLSDLGGSVVTPGQSSQDAIYQSYLSSPGAQQAGAAQTPDQVIQAGKGFDADLGNISTSQVPNAQGGMDNIVINPAKSAAEYAANRAMSRLNAQQGDEYQRATDLQGLQARAAQDLERSRQGYETGRDTAKFGQESAKVTADNANRIAVANIHAKAMTDARAAALGAGKDAGQMEMVNSLAAPAITGLESWYAENRNPNLIARAGSHVPLVGNMIVGAADPDFQTAQTNAMTLAQQYAQSLPKGRGLTAQTLAMYTKLLAPEVGDTPQTRATKLNNVETFKRALAKRAGAASAGAATANATAFPDFLDPPPDGAP